MPEAIEHRDTSFNKISIRELHPTFGAEISGVDFSLPLPEDVFAEILSAITKVCYSIRTAGIMPDTKRDLVWGGSVPPHHAE